MAAKPPRGPGINFWPGLYTGSILRLSTERESCCGSGGLFSVVCVVAAFVLLSEVPRSVRLIVPNEVQTIAEVLRRIAAADVDAEIVAAPLPAFRSWKMTVTP